MDCLMSTLQSFRNKFLNGWHRAVFIGKYVDFPEWCIKHNVCFDNEFYDLEVRHRPIVRCEFCKVPVGCLQSLHLGTRYKMKDSLVFKSLQGKVPYKQYKDACEKFGDISRRGKSDDYQYEILEWARSSMDKKLWPIIINQKNIILDGQHRACCALLDHGEESLVEAVRIFFLPDSGSLLQKIWKCFLGCMKIGR